MTITLPDDPALTAMGEAEILLDLACGAYAAGHVSRGVAARMAGLDRRAFDQTLCARHIPSYDEERWAQDLESIRALRSLWQEQSRIQNSECFHECSLSV
jgi:predicted HTH domain antitoxin